MGLHQKDSGTRVTRANYTDVSDPVPAPTDPEITILEDLIERTEYAGADRATGNTSNDQVDLKFRAGQRVKASELFAAFTPAVVKSITPNTGLAAGGTAVTINGTGLDGVTGVTFDGVAATAVTVVNPERVTCTTPAHAAGVVPVQVQDDDGAVTVANGFTYS